MNYNLDALVLFVDRVVMKAEKSGELYGEIADELEGLVEVCGYPTLRAMAADCEKRRQAAYWARQKERMRKRALSSPLRVEREAARKRYGVDE